MAPKGSKGSNRARRENIQKQAQKTELGSRQPSLKPSDKSEPQKGIFRRDTKPGGKNGKKGLSGSSFFTWFMVIALLGVWTSVAVVWFDLVDYEEVLAKAKDFRYNLSEVLQGKLGIYDADGDGDFDVDDAKVLLGLKERAVSAQPLEDSEEADYPASFEPDNLDDIDEPIQSSIHESLHSQHEDKGEPEEDDQEAEEDLTDLEDEEQEAIEEPKTEPGLAMEDEPEEEEEEEEEPAAVEEQEEEEEPEPLAAEEPEPAAVEETEAESVAVDEFEAEEEPTEEEPQPADLEEPEALDEEEPAEVERPQYNFEEQNYNTAVPENEEAYENLAETRITEQEEHNIQEPLGDEHVSNHKADEDYFHSEEYEEEEPQPADVLDAEQEEGEGPVDDESVNEDADRGELPDDRDLDEIDEDILHVLEKHFAEEAEQLQQTKEHLSAGAEETENLVEVEDVRLNDKTREEDRLAAEEQPEESAGENKSLSKEKKEKAKKKKPKLLNKFDKNIKAELDAAEKLRKKGKVDEAVKAFESLVNKYPQSPRARYGKAQCEEDLAEKMRSNDILLKAIKTFEEVVDLPNVPTDLVRLSLKRRANRQQFLGRMRGSVVTLQRLVQLYPDDVSIRNDLGVGYLLLGDNNNAKSVYKEVLSMAPNDGFAKVHYGFILKAENKIAESIPYLKEGLESGEPGTDDGRFYFHLGDALQRVGDKEAYTWYEAGHKKGHFASVWQRSLYNVNGLKAQPWWTAKETGYTDLVKTLETNWKVIRDEGLAVMDKAKGLFIPEEENLREKGDWSQYTLWQQGRKNENACKAAPRTCALLERFPESTECRRGQIKYSVMHPGTHVWPHTGPTNCRLRMHLGLVIPNEGCNIRCANYTRTWEEGKVLIFDDSFEHEVWQDADSYRLIFIVDAWHPELTPHQRKTLPAI
ncbi:aspartyl/asparaginyl beta-hydroxylase isoform X3 [Ascaphus truei]|uniref:aspartyl/asparaginyl beta-hydroxylase isoform X3 n=1 Tax=Ascaphus truei TaxID=8439 RepID=UPI003F5A725B